MNERGDPAGGASDDDLGLVPSAIRRRVRQRMNRALVAGWTPLPLAEARALLPLLVERFDEPPAQLFADPRCTSFYATLNVEPELAENFELLVEDAQLRAAPTPHPPATLSARLAAIRQPGMPLREVGAQPAARIGQPIVTATALPGWLASAAAGSRRVAEPKPERRYATEGDPGGAAPPGQPTLLSPPIAVAAGPGGDVVVLVCLDVVRWDARRWRVLVKLLDPASTQGRLLASPRHWRVSVAAGPRALAGEWVEGGTWQLADMLTREELAKLMLTVQPLA